MSTVRASLAPILIGLALAVGVTSFAAAEGAGTFGSRGPSATLAYNGAIAPTQQTAAQQAPLPSK
jgi:hypothetical protein